MELATQYKGLPAQNGWELSPATERRLCPLLPVSPGGKSHTSHHGPAGWVCPCSAALPAGGTRDIQHRLGGCEIEWFPTYGGGRDGDQVHRHSAGPKEERPPNRCPHGLARCHGWNQVTVTGLRTLGIILPAWAKLGGRRRPDGTGHALSTRRRKRRNCRAMMPCR